MFYSSYYLLFTISYLLRSRPLFRTRTVAVKIMLKMAAGIRNFQPKFIN